jgi:hypothetical protein
MAAKMANSIKKGSLNKKEEKNGGMMMKKLSIISLVLVVAFIASISIALADEATVTGTIEQSDAGLVLNADDGTYILAGEDVSAMVGKKVKAMGTISEGDNGKTLTVTAVEELAE